MTIKEKNNFYFLAIYVIIENDFRGGLYGK